MEKNKKTCSDILTNLLEQNKNQDPRHGVSVPCEKKAK